MKVIFSVVKNLPALSPEISLDWMPSFPDWTRVEKLSYLSSLRQASNISETHKQSKSDRLRVWKEGHNWNRYDRIYEGEDGNEALMCSSEL